MQYNGPCCVPECEKDAEFAIFGVYGSPDDDTYACKAHVGELLGTPVGLAENVGWTVVLIETETEKREREERDRIERSKTRT